ncbi:MAG: transposase family protein [Janthinobacterium lividum]
MGQVLRPAAVVPPGLVVDSVVVEDVRTVITVRALDAARQCPSCSSTTRRIHSRYRRILLDLPLGGRAVRLVVLARRFRCDRAACSQSIFTERFGNDILWPWARRTPCVDDLVHHLGLALGDRPAASFARRLMLVVSNDTLLRLVRRRTKRQPRHTGSLASTTGPGERTSDTGP